MEAVYRVVLVDDEEMILRGLQRAFPWVEFDCEVAGVARDGREGLMLIRQLRPDILLTDIRMPNMDGLGMVAALGAELPRMQIAVLTAFRDFDYAKQALSLGVCRYLLKPSKMEELREAFRVMTQRLSQLPPQPAGPEAEAEENHEAGAFVARAALKYIRAHYTEHLNLNDVAEQVFVSQWHLSKLINRHLKKSFLDIVNDLRVERAKELLSQPQRRVSEIAEAVGYADVAHFSRTFKRITGQTPMEYRGGLQ